MPDPQNPGLPDIMERLLSASPDEVAFFEAQIQDQLSALEEDYRVRSYRLKKLLAFIQTLQPTSGQPSKSDGTPKGFTRQEKAEIERLRNAGLPPEDIAEAMGVSTERIRRSLGNLGKPKPSSAPAALNVTLNGAAAR